MIAKDEGNLEGIVEEGEDENLRPTTTTGALVCPTSVSLLSISSGIEVQDNRGGAVSLNLHGEVHLRSISGGLWPRWRCSGHTVPSREPAAG